MLRSLLSLPILLIHLCGSSALPTDLDSSPLLDSRANRDDHDLLARAGATTATVTVPSVTTLKAAITTTVNTNPPDLLPTINPTAAAAAATSACPAYMVIEAPGLGDINGGWTGPTTFGILAKLKGGYRYTLQTPPPPDLGPNSNAALLVTQSTQGALEIVRVVAENYAKCPGIQFVIFGYSYGSIEVVEAANNPALLQPPIAAILLYGNCFWHPNRIENRGTAKTGTSACGGTTSLGIPSWLEGVTNDYCLSGDYLCTGSSYAAKDNTHWSYKNSQWQTDAINYAVSQLKSRGVN